MGGVMVAIGLLLDTNLPVFVGVVFVVLGGVIAWLTTASR
jgi:hypothetical protein